MSTDVGSGRTNQKLRTRYALLGAVQELLAAGHNPTLDDVAEAAMVSRATAYRYFPSVDALVAEAAVGQVAHDVATVIGDRTELLDRVLAAVAAATEGMLDNEVAAHAIAKSMAGQWLDGGGSGGDGATRPARRLGFIDTALAPHVGRLRRDVAARLRSGLALVCGMEAVISARDVAGLDRNEATATFVWAATALVAAAEEEAAAAPQRRSRRRSERP